MDYLVFLADNPAIMQGYTPYPEVLECFKSLGRAGVIHAIRLTCCLDPLIKNGPFDGRPPANLKRLFKWQREMMDARLAKDPERKRLAKETCDRLEGMFLQRWEVICDEKGWYRGQGAIQS